VCGCSTVSVWRIAAKLCHNDFAFVLPFLSFSLASSQGKEVLDIIQGTGEDQGAMAAMVVQATIQGMEAIMEVVALTTMAIMEVADQITMAIMVARVITLEGVAITMVADQITMADQAITQADLITMADQVITQADQTTMATMEDQDTTLEEGEVVLTTMATMVDLGTTLVAMATTVVVDLITTTTTVGPATTQADLITMATTVMVAVGTTRGAARVGMADQGATQDPRLTGKWSGPLLELLQSW